jgi:hypothetical protein
MKYDSHQSVQWLYRPALAAAFLLSVVLTAIAQDKIRFNAVYDCGTGKVSIKVLSCNGTGRNAKCQVFYINQYAPGGGHTEELERSFVEDNFVGQCAVKGGAAGPDRDRGGTDAAGPARNPAGNNDQNTAKAGQFKVGDRVHVSISGLAGDQYYQPCTIIRDLEHNSYGVGCDPYHGQPYKEYSVLPGWVRAWPNAAAAKFSVDKLRVDENDTVLADRELLDCDNLKHNGRNGTPPPADLARKLIRCLYERPSPAGQDGATTMDITEFSIGTPHRWHLHEDLGQGSAATLVYPVHVRWNMKTFYRTRNVQVTDKESMFTCFVDTTNLWQCGSAAGPHKDGKTEEVVVRKN